MPAGKIAAQCAHALSMLILKRCEIVSEDSNTVKLKISDEGSCLLKLNASNINLNFVNDEIFNQLSSNPLASVVIDNGLTCFNNVKTPTVIATTQINGIVENNLKFDVDKNISYKQIGMVNKNADQNEIVKIFAASSAQLLVNEFENNVLKLNKNSPLYSWLTGPFTKIVVGSRKINKFNALYELLSDNKIKNIRNGDKVMVTEPVPDNEAQIYSRFSTFSLV